MTMHVLLLQLDGKIVNFAIAQLAGYFRGLGHHVEIRHCVKPDGRSDPEQLQPRLGDPPWDQVYASLIFEWTRPLAMTARAIYPNVELGGTGWDFEDGQQVRRTDLPAEVIASPASYDGFFKDGAPVTYSVGFAQRGCRFSCGFCVVPRKEGKARSVGSLHDLWRGEPWPKQIVLLDNDFFGNPKWKEVIAEAQEHDFQIAVIQGINARLLSDAQADAVANTRWMSSSFHRRRVYTAWDIADDERTFFRGMERLTKRGISPDSIMVYMLIGYAPGEEHEDRDRRRAALRAFGARPYPMPYVHDGELGEELAAFQRWVVQRHDLHKTWEEFWGRARGNPRKLGQRRVSLPLFPEGA